MMVAGELLVGQLELEEMVLVDALVELVADRVLQVLVLAVGWMAVE